VKVLQVEILPDDRYAVEFETNTGYILTAYAIARSTDILWLDRYGEVYGKYTSIWLSFILLQMVIDGQLRWCRQTV
jgi:hypothetical protein